MIPRSRIRHPAINVSLPPALRGRVRGDRVPAVGVRLRAPSHGDGRCRPAPRRASARRRRPRRAGPGWRRFSSPRRSTSHHRRWSTSTSRTSRRSTRGRRQAPRSARLELSPPATDGLPRPTRRAGLGVRAASRDSAAARARNAGTGWADLRAPRGRRPGGGLIRASACSRVSVVSTPNATGTPVSIAGELNAARCLTGDEVEVRGLTADHAAERDHARVPARLRERHRGERQLEGSRNRHDRDRRSLDPSLSSSASACSSIGVVISALKRLTTNSRPSPSGTPSSTVQPSGTRKPPSACCGGASSGTGCSIASASATSGGASSGGGAGSARAAVTRAAEWARASPAPRPPSAARGRTAPPAPLAGTAPARQSGPAAA